MTTEGKIWGTTTEIYRDETISLHLLKILEGGYSSKHRHQKKANIFHVLEGELQIDMAAGPGWDITILTEGQAAVITSPTWHRFKALKPSLVLEIYKVTLEDPDIEREDRGGLEIKEDKDVKLNFKRRQT